MGISDAARAAVVRGVAVKAQENRTVWSLMRD
jgi:hypothetical protein